MFKTVFTVHVQHLPSVAGFSGRLELQIAVAGCKDQFGLFQLMPERLRHLQSAAKHDYLGIQTSTGAVKIGFATHDHNAQLQQMVDAAGVSAGLILDASRYGKGPAPQNI